MERAGGKKAPFEENFYPSSSKAKAKADGGCGRNWKKGEMRFITKYSSFGENVQSSRSPARFGMDDGRINFFSPPLYA